MKQIFDTHSAVMDEVRKTYPFAMSFPVCAFGILHTIYKNETFEEKIAVTKYYSEHSEGGMDYQHELYMLQKLKTVKLKNSLRIVREYYGEDGKLQKLKTVHTINCKR